MTGAEKENINTLEAKGEVILTMLSSIAQEESNSISANVKMGLMMRAREGKVVFRKTYGFIVTEDKTVQITPDEAEIVRLVFQNYLSGNSERKIIKLLENMKIPSPSGNDKWCVSTIQRLISNEKYCGDILTQKTANENLNYNTGRAKKKCSTERKFRTKNIYDKRNPFTNDRNAYRI